MDVGSRERVGLAVIVSSRCWENARVTTSKRFWELAKACSPTKDTLKKGICCG